MLRAAAPVIPNNFGVQDGEDVFPQRLIGAANLTIAQQRTALRAIILGDKKLLDKLLTILETVKNLRKKTNIAKSGGLASQVSGTITECVGHGLAAATPGVTSVCSIVAGPLLILGATGIFTASVAWAKIEKRSQEEMVAAVGLREGILERYMEDVAPLRVYVNHLVQIHGAGEREARRYILRFVQIFPWCLNAEWKAVISILDHCIDNYGVNLTVDGISFLYSLGSLLTSSEYKLSMVTIPEITKNGTTFLKGMTMPLGKLAALAGIPIAIAQAILLINDWVKDPEVVTTLKRYIDYLEFEIDHLQEVLNDLD